MARDIKEEQEAPDALAGEDAERFVAYVDNPVTPAGHKEYLQEADGTYSEIKPRSDAA